MDIRPAANITETNWILPPCKSPTAGKHMEKSGKEIQSLLKSITITMIIIILIIIIITTIF